MDTTPVGVRAASAAPGVLRARRRSTLLVATRRLLAIVGVGLGFWLLGLLLGATSASAHDAHHAHPAHPGHAATSHQVITGAARDHGSNATPGTGSKPGLIKTVDRVAHRVAPVITTTAHRTVDQVATNVRHVARPVIHLVRATVHTTTAPVRTVIGTTARSLRTPVETVTRTLHRTPAGATHPVHAVHLDGVVATHHSVRSVRARISPTIDATVTVPTNATRVAPVTTDSHPAANGARAAGQLGAPAGPCSPRPCDPVAGGSGSVGIVGSVHQFSASPGGSTTSARSSTRRSPAVSNTELVGAFAPNPTFAPD